MTTRATTTNASVSLKVAGDALRATSNFLVYTDCMANIIDLKSRRRRHLEQDALAFHLAHQAEAYQPPRHYIEQLRFRLRRRLGIDVATLRTRGEWESAVDNLFRVEMVDLLGQYGTPPEMRDMFPEFVDEVWRD